MYLTHLSIITLVLVYYSGIPGASQTKIRTLCPMPDLFRTIFGPMVRIRTKYGIPDLIGPTVPTGNSTQLPRNFTELPKSFTELPGFLEVQIQVLPGTAEVY